MHTDNSRKENMHPAASQEENAVRTTTLQKEHVAHPAVCASYASTMVDGVSRLLNAQPEFDGLEFEETRTTCTCTIHRKDRKIPTKVTEYLRECRHESAPWISHPRRMLRHASFIQCARIAFGIAALLDAEHGNAGEPARAYKTRMTPHSAATLNLPEGFSEYEAVTLPAIQDAARAGPLKLSAAFSALPHSPLKKTFWTLYGAQLKQQALKVTS
jgi:hypothetical protein